MKQSKKKQKKRFNVSARKEELHKLWSLKVRQRDGYICRWCEAEGRRNVDIRHHAHHIVAVSICGNHGRFELENGVTLCYHCHIDRLKAYTDEYNTFRDNWVKETLAMEYDELRRRYQSPVKFTEEFYEFKRRTLG